MAYILMCQNQSFKSAFVRYLDTVSKTLSSAGTEDIISYLGTRPECKEKSLMEKILHFYDIKKSHNESWVDYGQRCRVAAEEWESYLIAESITLTRIMKEACSFGGNRIKSSLFEKKRISLYDLTSLLDTLNIHQNKFEKLPEREKVSKACYLCGDSTHMKKDCPKTTAALASTVGNSGVPTKRIKWNGRESYILLDTGSSYNWVKKSMLQGTGIKTRFCEEVSVVLANGNKTSSKEMCTLSIDTMDGKPIQNIDFYVSNEIDLFTLGWISLKDQLHLLHADDITTPLVTSSDSETITSVNSCYGTPSVLSIDEYKIKMLNLLNDLENDVPLQSRPEVNVKFKTDNFKLKRPFVRKIKSKFLHGVRENLKEEINTGSISRVFENTGNISPILCVEKKGGQSNLINDVLPAQYVRICIDFTELNNYVDDVPIELPSIEEIIQQLQYSDFLSTMDAKQAFKQIKLDTSSKSKLKFYADGGIYQCENLPFGLACSPGIYCREMTDALKNIKSSNFMWYMDDFIFFGSPVEQLTCIEEVTRALRENGWEWNKDKIQILEPSVEFLGLRISGQGIQIPFERRNEIIALKSPSSRKELESLRGKLGYFSKMIPQIGVLTHCWNACTNFQWTMEDEQVFLKIKEILESNPQLALPPKSSKIYIIDVESGNAGLGAAVVWKNENNYGVAYWYSRKLTTNEKNYSSLDKWTVCIHNICKRLKKLIWNVYIECDTMEKLNRLSGEDEHQSGKKRVQRLTNELTAMGVNGIACPEVRTYLNDVINMRYTEDCFKWLKRRSALEEEIWKHAQQDDAYLNMLQNKFVGPYECYGKLKLSLYCQNGLMYRNGKIIIPVDFSTIFVQHLHQKYHEGINSLDRRIKRSYEIINKTKIIKSTLDNCQTCQTFRKSQPVKTTEWWKCKGPRERGHMDFFYVDKHTFFLLTDSFSSYPIAQIVKKKSDVVQVLQEIYDTFGTFDVLVADNEIVLCSKELEEFTSKHGTILLHSPIYSPQSNGRAESMVGILKRLMVKAQREFQLNTRNALGWFLAACRNMMDANGLTKIEKFMLPKITKEEQWFKNMKVSYSNEPIFFQRNKKSEWLQGTKIWHIGDRLVGVQYKNETFCLPKERTRVDKSLSEGVEDENNEEHQDYDSTSEKDSSDLQNEFPESTLSEKELKEIWKSHKYDAVVCCDGSTGDYNAINIVGLYYTENGSIKVIILNKNGFNHGAAKKSSTRLELLACIETVKLLKDKGIQKALILTDSRNVICSRKNINEWRRQGFKKKQNITLHEELDKQLQGTSYTITKVKGHDEITLNVLADKLARSEIEENQILKALREWNEA